MDAANVEKLMPKSGRPLAIRLAVGLAALSVGLQLFTKVALLRTLSQAPDLKAVASSYPFWLDLFSWAYLIGLAASAYGVWTRHRAARLVFSGLLGFTLVTPSVSTLLIVASLSSANGLTPRSFFR